MMVKKSQRQALIELSATTVALDTKLYELLCNIDILDAVAPGNYVEQRTLFFAQQFSKNPQFVYRKNGL
jgi:hypothetical protein